MECPDTNHEPQTAKRKTEHREFYFRRTMHYRTSATGGGGGGREETFTTADDDDDEEEEKPTTSKMEKRKRVLRRRRNKLSQGSCCQVQHAVAVLVTVVLFLITSRIHESVSLDQHHVSNVGSGVYEESNNNNNSFLRRTSTLLSGDNNGGNVIIKGSDENDNSNNSSNNTTSFLRSLREYDHEAYTIRINTWKRLDQLKFSLQHHTTCDHVAQIQVVWCDAQGDPPVWLYDIPKVVVERHTINSLNERFRVLTEPLTYGILSMDDDVMRPCTALDATFLQWTRHSDRLVGFDARTHVVTEIEQEGQDDSYSNWTYGYLSTTEQTNHYSMTLPRFAFVHVDYLHAYWKLVPAPILDFVDRHFNCEDVALSFWISSVNTDRLPPVLADVWAEKTMVKLSSKAAISDTSNHKQLRDQCVDLFANLLGLKQNNGPGVELQPHTLYHGRGLFHRGITAPLLVSNTAGGKLAESMQPLFDRWKASKVEEFVAETWAMKCKLWVKAYRAGLIENRKDRCSAALQYE